VVLTLGPRLLGLLLFCTYTSALLVGCRGSGEGSERGVAGMLFPASRSSNSRSIATALALGTVVVVVWGRFAVLFWLVVLLLALALLMLLK